MRKDIRFQSFGEVLSQFLTPQVWKEAHKAWDPARLPSRWRLSPLVWVLLGITWCCGDSLDERFATARAVYVASHGSTRRPGKSLQGFLEAVQRLPMRVLRALAEGLRQRFGEEFVDIWRVNGWMPIACDGTRLECPRTAELQQRLGNGCKPESAPMVYLTAMVLLPLGLLWSWQWGKGTANEHEHLRRMLPTLPPQALLVADAFYQGYELYSAIEQAGARFLVRLSSRSYLYTLRAVSLKRFKDREAYYWPDNSARSKGLPPIKVRVLRVRGRNGYVWLATNILDSQVLSHADAAKLYRWRWRSEGLFRQFKCMLNKTTLQSRTVATVHREGEGAMLALQLLLAHAALNHSHKRRAKQQEQKPTSVDPSLDSPRRILLGIRGVMDTELRLLGPRQWLEYRRMLQIVRCEWRLRTSSRTRQDWPRRKEHKPPKPPQLRVMDDKLKRLLQQHLDAA